MFESKYMYLENIRHSTSVKLSITNFIENHGEKEREVD